MDATNATYTLKTRSNTKNTGGNGNTGNSAPGLTKVLKIAEIVYRPDLYPRFQPSGALIQTYAANLDALPPIEVSDTGILIDGYHRLKAHETVGVSEIECIITPVKSEEHLLMLAVSRNSQFGMQLTQLEKKKYAVRWWNQHPEEEICATLSITPRLFRDWTRDKQQQKEEETRQKIYDMWLACYTQEAIGEATGIARRTVSDIIGDFGENDENVDLAIFANFEPKIYSVWSFPEATNEVRHFGNIPPEIIDNLLYYYTHPFDVVFDPFGGGGSTIDKCKARRRRYYVSDLTPIPARAHDMRSHDITGGLPADLPVPDLVFLDPPYWKQAEGRYSDKPTDLSNVELETFLDAIGDIAQHVKRKWSKAGGGGRRGILALIIGPYKHQGRYVDLPFRCYERISKYLTPLQRIVVPYSTQVHGGAYVQMAKEKREILYLHRDLMIFGYERIEGAREG